MDMGELLASVGVAEPRELRRGEVLDGKVMNVDREGALVDIGSKSEGIVPTQEMHSLGADPLSKVASGDDVLVYVVQPETAEGQVLLSIDRARGEQGWRLLQERFESGEIFDAEVTGFNKGGLLANVEGVNAFIPMSQVVGAKPGSDGASPLSAQVGRGLRLKVIEINRRRNRVILSERAALQEYRAEQKERLLEELAEGEIRTGSVTSIRNFGVFVDLGGADGLVHLSELSWDRSAAPEEMFKRGDEVQVYVMRVDRENKKIALSIRRASPEQWEELIMQYAVGDVVAAVITKLVAFGAFARLPGPVEGLVHVSELVERRIGHPQEVVEEGDVVPLKIVRIEHDRHRLGLSLSEARREAEMRGWAFDSQGRVTQISEEAQATFSEETEAAENRMVGRRAQAEAAPAASEATAGGGAAGAAAARDEFPPMTAMAAAMQEAQAQLDAQGGEPQPAEGQSMAAGTVAATDPAPAVKAAAAEAPEAAEESPAEPAVEPAAAEAPEAAGESPAEPAVEPAAAEAPEAAEESPAEPAVEAAATEAPEAAGESPAEPAVEPATAEAPEAAGESLAEPADESEDERPAE